MKTHLQKLNIQKFSWSRTSLLFSFLLCLSISISAHANLLQTIIYINDIKYRLTDIIGSRGAEGTVYRATPEDSNGPTKAVKVLSKMFDRNEKIAAFFEPVIRANQKLMLADKKSSLDFHLNFILPISIRIRQFKPKNGRKILRFSFTLKM